MRTASTAEEALLRMEEQQPDLVLMDIVLAGSMTGIEAAKLVAARFQVPVVYLTAHTHPATLEEIKETEEHGLLSKPFRPEQLHTAIELGLARYGREQQRSAAQRKPWNRTPSNTCSSSRALPDMTYGDVISIV